MNSIPLTHEERRGRAAERLANTRKAMKVLKPMGFILQKNGVATLNGFGHITADTQDPDIYNSKPEEVLATLLLQQFRAGASKQRKTIREALGIID